MIFVLGVADSSVRGVCTPRISNWQQSSYAKDACFCLCNTFAMETMEPVTTGSGRQFNQWRMEEVQRIFGPLSPPTSAAGRAAVADAFERYFGDVHPSVGGIVRAAHAQEVPYRLSAAVNSWPLHQYEALVRSINRAHHHLIASPNNIILHRRRQQYLNRARSKRGLPAPEDQVFVFSGKPWITREGQRNVPASPRPDPVDDTAHIAAAERVRMVQAPRAPSTDEESDDVPLVRHPAFRPDAPPLPLVGGGQRRDRSPELVESPAGLDPSLLDEFQPEYLQSVKQMFHKLDPTNKLFNSPQLALVADLKNKVGFTAFEVWLRQNGYRPRTMGLGQLDPPVPLVNYYFDLLYGLTS